jgi:hypothetical protein
MPLSVGYYLTLKIEMDEDARYEERLRVISLGAAFGSFGGICVCAYLLFYPITFYNRRRFVLKLISKLFYYYPNGNGNLLSESHLPLNSNS